MKTVCLIFLLSMLIACSDKNHVPRGVLAPAKMEDLVWDVMTADEYARDMAARDTTRNTGNLKKQRSIIYQQVFDLHGTDREEFMKSFNYYASRPDLTKNLYDTLATRANRKREESFRRIKIAR